MFIAFSHEINQMFHPTLGGFPPHDDGDPGGHRRSEILMEPAFRTEFGKLQDKIPPMSVPGLHPETLGAKQPKNWGKPMGNRRKITGKS